MSIKTTRSFLIAVACLATFVLPAVGDYPSTVLSDSPIGYWRLGEASGPTAADSSGFSRDLSYNNFSIPGDFGQPGAVFGSSNTGIKFTPGSPRPTLSRGNNTDFGFASGQSVSVEYWVKAAPFNSTSNEAGLITKGYDSSQVQPWYLSRYKSNNRVDFFLRSPDRVATSTSSIEDNRWHQVVGVYDSSAAEVRIFVDGALEGTTGGVAANPYGTNSRPFTIGNHLNRAVDATMDEVAIYGAALTNAQVAAHYNAAVGTPALSVDFGSSTNSGGGPGGTQAGFQAFEGTESSGTSPLTMTFTSAAGVAGDVDVTIGNYTHFRDYAGLSGSGFGSENNLLSDMVLRNANGTFTLELENLEAGDYELLTFHHSTQFGGGDFDVKLTDENGVSDFDFDVPVTDNPNTNELSTLTIPFSTDGTALFEFLGGTASQHFSLNGFQLFQLPIEEQVVPEPASIAIWSLLGLCLAGYGYRRRNR